MKYWKIIVVNIIIVLVVVGSISLYTTRQRENSRAAALSAYENTAASMERVLNSYMLSEQQLVDSWANSVNVARLTMETAIHFLEGALGKSDSPASIHLVWSDDYSEGLSTQAHFDCESDYSVSYAYSKDFWQSYESSPAIVLDELDFFHEKVHMTKAYTNPISGKKVVSFCHKIYLIDKMKKREAIMLYVLPEDYLKERWIFATEYTGADVAVIEANGNYIIQPISMKNTNFYEFLFSYNQLRPDEIKETVFESGNGNITALDSKGEMNVYAYAKERETEAHAILVGMPYNDLVVDTTDWTIILVTMVALAIALVVNLLYFRFASQKEHEQIDIILKQGARLEVALAEAQHANRSKTIFLNNMSHDIRTPMNAIIGFTLLAVKSIDEKEQVMDYLQKISTSSTHLLSLINDVLDMSRIESGKMKLDEECLRIPSIVKDLKTIVLNDAQVRQLDFQVEMNGIEHETVYGDKLRLNQILLNLVSNAMKFTKAGGSVTVIISEKECAKEGKASYEFRVKDTGIGMSKEFSKHVFEPFERERTSTVSGIQGTGLGMSITKKIVDMMQGSITVDSEEGVGTEFTVKITFRICEASEAFESDAQEQISIDFEGKKLLLVEDNELNQEIAIAILEDVGFIIDVASDGVEAVEKVEKAEPGQYDIILMDIQMPIMDGYHATEKIRQMEDSEKSSLPIIAMTANAFEEDKKKALECGMNGHVAKPIKIELLLETLAKIMKK